MMTIFAVTIATVSLIAGVCTGNAPLAAASTLAMVTAVGITL